MSFTEHPLRRWAVDEMHLRRFVPVPERCELVQSVRLVTPSERGAEDNRLISNRPDFDEWRLSERHGLGTTRSGIAFVWERHTEASTITLLLPPDMPPGLRETYASWTESWMGDVVRATRIHVEPDAESAARRLAEMAMAEEDLVCCTINAGVRLWSDFAIHKDGYGRLLIQAGDTNAQERGRIVQRVQELGNYRNLAMLGFPLVQRYGQRVDALEQALAEQARSVAGQQEDDSVMIQQLADLSSELELLRSETAFRLSATKAYAEIAQDRLRALDIKPAEGFQSLTEFTERRLVPAARTCANFERRLDTIAERIGGIMHTLDTRVDTRIKAQNLQLTRSMERSTQLQFRLQTLIEGLSVIAAAYYAVGLIGFLVKGFYGWKKGSEPDMWIGLVTLPVIFGIYWLVSHLRHRVMKADEDARES